jgi:hypothetical protein
MSALLILVALNCTISVSAEISLVQVSNAKELTTVCGTEDYNVALNLSLHHHPEDGLTKDAQEPP